MAVLISHGTLSSTVLENKVLGGSPEVEVGSKKLWHLEVYTITYRSSSVWTTEGKRILKVMGLSMSRSGVSEN